MAKSVTVSPVSTPHVKSSKTESEQLSYVLETVQQYEDECLLSSRNQEEARLDEPLVSVQQLLSVSALAVAASW